MDHTTCVAMRVQQHPELLERFRQERTEILSKQKNSANHVLALSSDSIELDGLSSTDQQTSLEKPTRHFLSSKKPGDRTQLRVSRSYETIPGVTELRLANLSSKAEPSQSCKSKLLFISNMDGRDVDVRSLVQEARQEGDDIHPLVQETHQKEEEEADEAGTKG